MRRVASILIAIGPFWLLWLALTGSTDPNGTLMDFQQLPLDPEWMLADFHWRIWPNPPFETITLTVEPVSPGSQEFRLDEVLLITECIPENEHFMGILALVGLGAVRLLRSRSHG